VLNALRAGALASAKVSKDQSRLNEKKAGAYTHFLMAGIEAGDTATLDAAAEVLEDEIRRTGKVTGEDGKAYSVNAKPNKDASAFLIPSAIMSAKSVVRSALDFGIGLFNSEGDPESFTAIRKLVQAENAKRALDEATGDAKKRIELRQAIDALSVKIGKMEGAELAEWHATLTGIKAAPELAQAAEPVRKAA
jgi:hypothetical protein